MDRLDDECLDNYLLHRRGSNPFRSGIPVSTAPVPIDSWGEFDTITIDRKGWELWVVLGIHADPF